MSKELKVNGQRFSSWIGEILAVPYGGNVTEWEVIIELRGIQYGYMIKQKDLVGFLKDLALKGGKSYHKWIRPTYKGERM